MSEGKVRIDKWLWAARFFKTRSMAASAVNGGKVHVNGSRVKSSKSIQIEDQLEITRGQLHAVVRVKELSEKRGPATGAQLLYTETDESIKKREIFTQQRKFLNANMPVSKGRPDKQQRRQLLKISGKHNTPK